MKVHVRNIVLVSCIGSSKRHWVDHHEVGLLVCKVPNQCRGRTTRQCFGFRRLHNSISIADNQQHVSVKRQSAYVEVIQHIHVMIWLICDMPSMKPSSQTLVIQLIHHTHAHTHTNAAQAHVCCELNQNTIGEMFLQACGDTPTCVWHTNMRYIHLLAVWLRVVASIVANPSIRTQRHIATAHDEPCLCQTRLMTIVMTIVMTIAHEQTTIK
jgi:hypothetical protein